MNQNILIKLSCDEIKVLKLIALEWFNMEDVCGEWISNWESAVKIHYRSDSWNENQLIDIEEDLLDSFKDCIQCYLTQGFENKIGENNFNVARNLFLNIYEILEINFPVHFFIPTNYYPEGKTPRNILVDPNANPLIELAKNGVYINNKNQN